MKFTNEYKEKIEFILYFLRIYDTLGYDQYRQIVLNKEKEPLDYWLCQSSECLKLSMKNLRKELPKYTRLFSEMHSNDVDHDGFECCTICDKPLNKYLTFYEDELIYLIETIQTKNDILEEGNCFKIVGLLESTSWLCDSLNSEKAKENLLQFIDMIIYFINED